jgi:hypothetical protein
MSFDFNSSFNLLDEENVHVYDNSSEESKKFEIKNFEPIFQNELEFPQICELGIDLGDILIKDSSPDETESNIFILEKFLKIL